MPSCNTTKENIINQKDQERTSDKQGQKDSGLSGSYTNDPVSCLAGLIV
jgi:hypothetical protein